MRAVLQRVARASVTVEGAVSYTHLDVYKRQVCNGEKGILEFNAERPVKSNKLVSFQSGIMSNQVPAEAYAVLTLTEDENAKIKEVIKAAAGTVEKLADGNVKVYVPVSYTHLDVYKRQVLGQSLTTVTLVIGFLGWTEFARLIYASVLSVREKDYVESAKAIGAKNDTILLRYVLPNSFAPVIISFTFRTAQAIITESSLSFLRCV